MRSPRVGEAAEPQVSRVRGPQRHASVPHLSRHPPSPFLPCTADSFTRNAATLTRTSPTPVRALPRVARRRGSFGTRRQCLIGPIRGRKMPIDRGLHACQTMALRCSRPARPRTGFTSNNHVAPLERDERCPRSASALNISSPEGHAPRKDAKEKPLVLVGMERLDRRPRELDGGRARPL